jgi:hypothetical protein
MKQVLEHFRKVLAMAGLVPAIHVFGLGKEVDARPTGMTVQAAIQRDRKMLYKGGPRVRLSAS